METDGVTAATKAADETGENAILFIVSQSKDAETTHMDADDYLCTVLEGLGYVKTVAAFRAMKKWYS